MPLHRIYAPADLFSAEEKMGLAQEITSMYTAGGLPPFYVIVLFIPLQADEIYIGGLNHTERKEKMNGKPFVRIVSQHLARTAVEPAKRQNMVQRLDAKLKKHIKDKGYEYELHIEEPPADLWLMSGIVPPAPGSEAEKKWNEMDAAEPYEGQTIAEYFQEKYPDRIA